MVIDVTGVFSQTSKEDFLKSELNQIEHYLIYKDRTNKKVSRVTVAWHLDHILKVINRVSHLLMCSNPENYKENINITRIFSFMFGYIPKGGVNSSIALETSGTIHIGDIVTQLIKARDRVEAMESVGSTSNFNHLIFGQLNKRQTKRFLEIHTKHHLKIIKNILKTG